MEASEDENMLKKKYNHCVILLAVELLVVVILLPGVFRKAELMYFFEGQDLQISDMQSEGMVEAYSRELILTPGVYRVRVEAALEKEQVLGVEIKSDNASFRALRTNIIPIFPGDDLVEYEVWVSNKLSDAYVQCNFMNADISNLKLLTIYKTAMGDRMLLVIMVFFFGVLDGMIFLRKKILEGRVTRKQQMVFWTLLAGIFLAYFPYLTDYCSIGADAAFHWSRIEYLKNSLLQGSTFPVRVQNTWLSDHGYAVSIFYGDLFLYIPAFLRLLGFPIMTAYKMFVFLILAATAVIAYYSFRKCVKEEYAALFGSMVYLLIPYHIQNIYNRAAVGECLAMAFLPLVCCGMYLLYTKDMTSVEYRKYKWYIVWGMSGIVESHVISTEMTAMFMALFCVLACKKTFRRQTLLQLAQATGLVLLINAWFWFPLLFMMNSDTYFLQSLPQAEVQSHGVLFAGLFQWLTNMGGAQTGMWNCEPLHVGAGASLILLFYILWRCRTGKGNKTCDVLLGFSLLTVLMSTRILPWNRIKKLPGIGFFISSLQFPYRWLVLASVFVSLLAAFVFREVGERGGRTARTAMGIAVVVTLFSSVYHVNSIAVTAQPLFLYNFENMSTGIHVGNGEYLLADAIDGDPELSLSTILSAEYSYHGPVAQEGIKWWGYDKNGTEITISVENETEGTRYIDLPLLGYRGYAVHGEAFQGEKPYIADERGAHGDLRVAVPAEYRGELRVCYDGLTSFHIAEAVSLASIVMILGGYLYRKRKRVL